MEIENELNSQEDLIAKEIKRDKISKRYLLLLNCVILAIGSSGGPLLLRLYFIHGGKRVWLSSFLETAGWPLMFIPLLLSYLHRRKHNQVGFQEYKVKPFFMTWRLFIASAALGTLTGVDDYIYAYGLARLPVSTSAIVISTQLAFTAGFAFLLVKQKFTPYSINAVVMLTVAAVVLGLHTNGDRPNNESNMEYNVGFFLTLAAAALYGFVLPMVELTYKKAKQTVTYTLVMEMQIVMMIFATVFCVVGMIVNKDFQAIPEEARAFAIGKWKYYMVLVVLAIIWQFFFFGAIGVIFCSSSLLSGIIIAVLIPVTEVLAVIIYNEPFKTEKGISLALSLWGFVSYFYGEFKQTETKELPDTEYPRSTNSLQT